MSRDRSAHKRIVITVPDLPAIEARAKAAGSEVTKSPGGSSSVRFLTDLDGYSIEVILAP